MWRYFVLPKSGVLADFAAQRDLEALPQRALDQPGAIRELTPDDMN